MNIKELRQALDAAYVGEFTMEGPSVIYDAARRLLDSETVLWCENHDTSLRPGTNECWIGYDITMGNADDLCRMVDRLLIPITESSSV